MIVQAPRSIIFASPGSVAILCGAEVDKIVLPWLLFDLLLFLIGFLKTYIPIFFQCLYMRVFIFDPRLPYLLYSFMSRKSQKEFSQLCMFRYFEDEIIIKLPITFKHVGKRR